jgi:hypothetical protein
MASSIPTIELRFGLNGAMDVIVDFDMVQPSAEIAMQGGNMNLSNVSSSVIHQLQEELDPFEQQAKKEMKDPQTRSLGILRMDLVEECRRRLNFFQYMVKDAEEHSAKGNALAKSGRTNKTPLSAPGFLTKRGH